MKKAILKLLMLILFAYPINLYSQSDNKENIDKYQWNLTDIYQSWDEWENDYSKIDSLIDGLAIYKGKISSDEQMLLKSLKLMEKVNLLAYKVYFYPQLTLYIDQNNEMAASQVQKVYYLFAKWSDATGWFKPELYTISESKLKSWLTENAELNQYEFYIQKMLDELEHVLDENSENLASNYYNLTKSPSIIYSSAINMDLYYPEIKLSNGKVIKLTEGEYSKILRNDSLTQEDRELAYNGFNKLFVMRQDLFASIYTAVCQSNWAEAQVHKYNTSLESYLFADNISPDIYLNLIELVGENTQMLKDYLLLRKEIISNRKELDEFWVFDNRLELSNYNKDYNYDDAKEWILKSVEPLGGKYQNLMKELLSDGYVDVYEREGKTTSVFTAGVYGVHPYALINYNSTIDAVLSLAHEMGHMAHTQLSIDKQSFFNATPVLFTAEVSSIFNERLMLDYMLNTIEDPMERILILDKAINVFINKFFHATILADFEYKVHEKIENQQPTNAETLNTILKELDEKYYGNYCKTVSEFDGSYWIRMTQLFNTPFYLFKYATCYVSASKIYDEILKAENSELKEKSINKYLNFLESGDNDYPMEILKELGIDLSNKDVYISVIDYFNSLVSELKSELEKINAIDLEKD